MRAGLMLSPAGVAALLCCWGVGTLRAQQEMSSANYRQPNYTVDDGGQRPASAGYQTSVSSLCRPASGAESTSASYRFRAGYVAGIDFTANTVPSISAVALDLAGSGSSTQVRITYTVVDAQGNLISFVVDPSQVQYSTDGTNWNNATISGTTSGVTSSAGGTEHQDLFWDAYTDLGNTPGTVYVRIRPHDGSSYSSGFTAPVSTGWFTRPTAGTPYVNRISAGAQSGAASPATLSGDTTTSDLSGIAFSAVFTDTAGDTGAKYQIEVDDTADFSSPVWSTAAGGTPLEGALAVGARCRDIVYAGPVLSYNTIYYWRLRFWDQSGNVGAWSAGGEQLTLVLGLSQDATIGRPAGSGAPSLKLIAGASFVFKVVYNGAAPVSLRFYARRSDAGALVQGDVTAALVGPGVNTTVDLWTDGAEAPWYRYDLSGTPSGGTGVLELTITCNAGVDLNLDDLIASQ